LSGPDWQTVIDEHGSRVWSTAYRLLGHEADASDCFQEAFVSALELSQRQRVRNMGALLTRLATLRAIDRLRQRKRLSQRFTAIDDLSDVPGSVPDPARAAESAELGQALREAIACLSGPQAQAFCLRYFSDMSVKQIGQTLNMPTGTVGVLLHRARGRLRELLGKQEHRANEVGP
jgi:RNA polymerase sigma-70 factor, ECF subfamily